MKEQSCSLFKDTIPSFAIDCNSVNEEELLFIRDAMQHSFITYTLHLQWDLVLAFSVCMYRANSLVI